MDLGLRGRTALVCGASAGIGLACAEALVEEGANAVMLARRREVLEREAARLGGTAVPGDVSDPDDLQRAVDTALATYGALDIVIVNGGGPPFGPATSIDGGQLQAAVELLLLPTVRLVNLALPHLRRSDQGRIVLIASSSVREPIPGLALSNAVRPGVVGYMKTPPPSLRPRGSRSIRSRLGGSPRPGRSRSTRASRRPSSSRPSPPAASASLGRSRTWSRSCARTGRRT
jgi:3-oxoacyl-[acyl-carrier protein] reductase